MKPVLGILERALVYRLWQAPFADRKLAPVLANNDLGAVRRVLDVGCGPGTNAHHFECVDYVGVDLNPRYVEHAARRTGRRFLVADVSRALPLEGELFDFVLVNSLLHHLDDAAARRTLANVAAVLSDDGHVHVLDLVLPERPSIARLLARLDRGDFPRPLAAWEALLGEFFEVSLVEPYRLGPPGVTLWYMVYLKGGAARRERPVTAAAGRWRERRAGERRGRVAVASGRVKGRSGE